MESVTLAQAKAVADVINEYKGEPDFRAITDYVKKKVKISTAKIAVIIEFLQSIQVTSPEIVDANPLADSVKRIAAQPVDIATELNYNYAVARTLLDSILKKSALPDGEEIRKTLREISRFSESILKMQERVTNLDQMTTFQQKVLDILENYPEIAEALIRADL